MKIPFKISLQPLTIFIVTLILLSMFSVFALIEFTQSRKEILSMMENEGVVLLDAMMAGAERSILAYEEVENQLQNRLLSAARAVENADAAQPLDRQALGITAGQLNVHSILLFTPAGRVEAGFNAGPEPDFPDWISPILSGEVQTAAPGLTAGGRYAAGVRRKNGGAVVVETDARDLLQLRREVGPGRFIQEIAGSPGVRYMVLQDTLGIRMASRGVRQISAIAQDPFLAGILRTGIQSSRITLFEGSRVFEIAAPFVAADQDLGLFRIGLTLTVYEKLVRSARIRLILIAVSLILLGIVGFGLVMTTQNMRTLSESYNQVKTHTGEILQNLKDAVVAVDGGGLVTVYNNAAESVFELPREAVVNRSVRDLEPACFEYLKNTLKTGKEIRALEERCLIRNQWKSLRLNTSVVRNPGGIIDSAILVATDITHQRELEEQLHREEKLQAMGALASGVAHEVRNPINAIGMIAQRFRKEFRPVRDEEEYRLLTETMHQEVKRIDRIIRQFLEFSRPPSLHLSRVSAAGLIGDAAAVFSSSASAAGVEFHAEAEAAFLLLDADQMKQVLLNLLQNSLDACRPGHEIRLSGRSEGPDYVFSVTDTGTGIPAQDLNRIFDLYYTTKPNGTGIGLPMVAQIVQAHGGSVHVESGSGSTRFTIRLPKPDPEKS